MVRVQGAGCRVQVSHSGMRKYPNHASAPFHTRGFLVLFSSKLLLTLVCPQWNSFRNTLQHRELVKYIIATLLYSDASATVFSIYNVFAEEIGVGTDVLVCCNSVLSKSAFQNVSTSMHAAIFIDGNDGC